MMNSNMWLLHITDRTTVATSRNHKETRNLQHTDPSVGKIKKKKKKLAS
jgi:hypothetical protein